MLRIRELREAKRMNQEKLAIELNISQSSISKYEVGSAEPDIETILKLSRFFCVTTDYLLGYSDVKVYIEKNDFINDEVELLSIYRSLDDNRKQRVIAYLKGISENY